jgi:SNF2 family DNA or RNA helicase
MFSDPLTQAIESSSVEKEKNLVSRLHDILRPFILRRLKRDVEAQMPSKYEHILRCTLSQRQKVRGVVPS